MAYFSYRLDLQFFAGEKTEPATPRKKKEAREKGQVARSPEIPAAVGLMTAMLALALFGSQFLSGFKQLFMVSLHSYHKGVFDAEMVNAVSMEMLTMALWPLLPFLGIVMGAGILANLLQVGPLLTFDPVKPKLERMNPLEGAKRILSLRSVVDLFKSILKVLIVGGIAYLLLWNERYRLLQLFHYPLGEIERFIYDLLFRLGLSLSVTLLIIALFDYLFQRYEYMKNLRMTKQEVKDEWKKIEGDPLIKSKIRERQRQMAMLRMMQEVPKADVVVTNPTHFAVGIKYEAGKMKAPVVIAKGQDYLALRIKEVAKAHEIPLMENKPLAQALYHRVEIGETIPEDLFKAVAEVLAYVYHLKQRKRH